jgi:hypothetical protein
MDNRDRVPGECGFGIEGSNRPGRNATGFRRLKQLGIEVRYVAMDEPLTFGHYYITGTGPGASDAEAVAARKQNIQAVEASGLEFDLVDVANWTPHPSRNLPQSDPATLTSVVAWYRSRHSSPSQYPNDR